MVSPKTLGNKKLISPPPSEHVLLKSPPTTEHDFYLQIARVLWGDVLNFLKVAD